MNFNHPNTCRRRSREAGETLISPPVDKSISSHFIDAPAIPSPLSEHGVSPSPFALHTSHLESGVALVITLILLSVITFMAVTFLVVSRNEKGSVATGTDQTIATLAAETAVERATSDLMSRIIAFTNEFEFDLMVSRNYVNQNGFDTSLAVQNPTNVNYDYVDPHVTPAPIPITPLTPAQQLKNIANLLYDPRPPVFIGTNAEFRFYLDLNRNGRFDTNGLQPVISPDPAKPYYDTNGNTMATIIPGNTLSNVFVGDPEWIGVLQKPAYPPSLVNPPGIQPPFAVGYPHSATNQFISRFAYLIVPSGKTLDLNSVYDYVKTGPGFPSSMLSGDGFFRNQGVGPWEMNLAAFLVDLNTNMWFIPPPAGLGSLTTTPYYRYDTNIASASQGSGFEDAASLLRYRYASNYANLATVKNLFGANGVNAFRNDFVDGYSSGPLMTGTHLTNDYDQLAAPGLSRPTRFSWPGSDNPNHFFSTQDLFDKSKTAIGIVAGVTFTDRLLAAGTNRSSYDRYTFYRLLAQMGTDSDQDSAAAPVGKLNINYANVDNNGTIIPNLATNFNQWKPVQFFTNVVNKLLTAQGVNFDPRAIPVYTNKVFAYSPAVQRLLQLAANIYDATTNSVYPNATTYPYLPSVFRPTFSVFTNNVYITGFVEVLNTNMLVPAGSKLVDLVVQGPVGLNANDLVYGVPVIIGAKKGLPSFNEFSLKNLFTLSRKMKLSRLSVGGAITTNISYMVNVSGNFGVGAWNSYTSNYMRQVDIYVNLNAPYDATHPNMLLTNDAGLRWQGQIQPVVNTWTNLLVWRGFTPGKQSGYDPAFILSMVTNVAFIPDSMYTYSPVGLTTNLTTLPQTGFGFPLPRWGLGITNRLQFLMVDTLSQRVIDYVQLRGMDIARDLSSEIYTNSGAGFAGLWSTNRSSPSINVPFDGLTAQAQISSGATPLTSAPGGDWQGYGTFQTGVSVQDQISQFARFIGGDATFTNLEIQAGFTAMARMYQYQSWQANDPLVHYTISDLTDVVGKGDGTPRPLLLDANVPPLALATNVTGLTRYHPWGGKDPGNAKPADMNLAIQDPAVGRSDHWDFPTNKFPNIGWLGRVHRGTPWQTVYLKASDIGATDLKTWGNWCGSTNVFEAAALAPANDRRLLEVFTTAFNDNAARGQLSVNQTNLAVWSALLSGVVALQGTINGIASAPATNFPFVVIDPVGTNGQASPLLQMITAINNDRKTNYHGAFQHLGDILSVPELTENSPFLNLTNTVPHADPKWGISDEVYERIPQQVLGLLKVDHTPRFVVYGYGQALKPAPHSVLTSGPFFGMVTNYQITAEVAVRAVVRIEGAPINGGSGNPHAVIESYNVLGPDQ